MEVKGKEEASKSIKIKLSNYKEPATQRCIYRVHNQYLSRIRDKPNLNEPLLVSIGPYHRGRQGLNMMEEHKIWYLKSYLLRKHKDVDIYISAIAEVEEEARSYYAEGLSYLSSYEFIEMLLLDGCFIIELLLKSESRDSSCGSDPIFQMDWIMQGLQLDLILFENQIPFFVLSKLFDLIHPDPSQHNKLIDLFCLFYAMEDVDRPKGINPRKVKHLLHLLHAVSRNYSHAFVTLNACPLQMEYRLIPSATELKNANVTFRKSRRHDEVWGVDFRDGVLTMSGITIQDHTESFFRNFIVYEQYFPDNQPTYVTDYSVVLDCLINTGQDVEILCECGIIENMVGDNQVAADIINRLNHSVTLCPTHFIYADVFKQINDHYKKRWNKARAVLKRDYFNSRWAYISFVAALFLLLLTLAQTIFAALQLS